MLEDLRKTRQHLLTGVSYAIPFIACGGILIAAALAFAPHGEDQAPDPRGVPMLAFLLRLGESAFHLMLPVLAGYIAYGVAGKPALVAGFIGGFLADEIKAGFLGAIIIGLIAGWIVNGLKAVPVHRHLKPVMPILVIPILSTAAVGVLMLLVLGEPIAALMKKLELALQGMQDGSAMVLAATLGAMIAFDMGGPVNKAAFFFGAALIKESQFAVMGACAAAICTPPLGLGLATLLRKSLWRDEDRKAGIAALAMGMMGITEGAIPFAAADPFRVIPSIMLGSMVAAMIAMRFGVGDPAPHGGPIVLPIVQNPAMYVVAIIAGTLVTAASIIALKSIAARREAAPTEALA